MFNITIPDEMLEKLRDMLEDEDEESCVRLREYKVGSGWHAKIMLGLGIDEPEEDEDMQIEINDVPFIAEEDFLIKYGKEFSLEFNENKEVVLTALSLQ